MDSMYEAVYLVKILPCRCMVCRVDGHPGREVAEVPSGSHSRTTKVPLCL